MKLIEERKEILKYSKLLMDAGLIHSGQGNISVLNREEGLVAITPSAVEYNDRQIEDICIVDKDGNLVEGKWQPTSEIAVHLIFYNRRSDVSAVIHTHAPKATVFGIIGDDPMPMVLNESAMCIGGPVPIAPYARPGSERLAELNLEVMGDGLSVIMAHHGLVTVGTSLAKAYLTSISVEITAEAIIQARSMGREPIPIKEEEVSVLREKFLKYEPKKT